MFTATALTARDSRLTVTGELAIGSSRLRLEIPVSVEQTADGALRLKAKTTVSRKAAGLAWNKLGMIGSDAMLHAQLTLKPATSQPRARDPLTNRVRKPTPAGHVQPDDDPGNAGRATR